MNKYITCFFVISLFVFAGCENTGTPDHPLIKQQTTALSVAKRRERSVCGVGQLPLKRSKDTRTPLRLQKRDKMAHEAKKRQFTLSKKPIVQAKRLPFDYKAWAQPTKLQASSAHAKVTQDFEQAAKQLSFEGDRKLFMEKWRALKRQHFGKGKPQ